MLYIILRPIVETKSYHRVVCIRYPFFLGGRHFICGERKISFFKHRTVTRILIQEKTLYPSLKISHLKNHAVDELRAKKGAQFTTQR